MEVPGRKIYLPLAQLDKCLSCGRAGNEVKLKRVHVALYCSTECQKKDWKAHKPRCGATDRIDLQSYFPLLACGAHSCHTHPKVSTHPALTHKILNSPNPTSGEIVKFPNGVEAKLVLLGESLPDWEADMATASETWWPSALDAKVRDKLKRRILEEGNILSIVLATCIALVAELYTTTAIPTSETPKWQPTGRRLRLSYDRSPIADLGIVRGSVRVTPQDRLAYYHLERNTFMMGQDPDDHYWIYFTTLAGEEYSLDCGMMTFNFCKMVQTAPYCLPTLVYAPVFFYGKERAKALPLIDRLAGSHADPSLFFGTSGSLES
ncbi:hypothetical protein M413DRAFT_28031 [Hebeloma cylindrosporum]|uniref:MYND-type domain-containing protein n=1 Tax=Hebeloma cylindrosporum TaxID=76867 RepID=A0A0C3C9L3_HEBCY|nr:hypothetical protein M413DRAFT_28031 [Hebeloma cylindrosporum h7]